MTDNAPLSDCELQSLVRILGSGLPAARDLLTFSGASTASGLLSRMVILDRADRSILLAAVRKAIASANHV